MDSMLGRGCTFEGEPSTLESLCSPSKEGGDCSLLAPKYPGPVELGGLLPLNSCSSKDSNREVGRGGANGCVSGCEPLTVGYTDTGRKPGVSTSVFMPAPGLWLVGDDGVPGAAASAEVERKYKGLPWLNELAIVRGGNLLMRLPPLVVSSNCLASNRLWAAKASNGDSSGGISPATCRRGDGKPRGDGRPCPKGPWDCDRKSMKLGRCAIASEPSRTVGSVVQLSLLDGPLLARQQIDGQS
jgi:hypothetical protein